jgi:hypothetical protein
MTAFWDIAQRSLVKLDRSFRGASLCQRNYTALYIHTRRRENPKYEINSFGTQDVDLQERSHNTAVTNTPNIMVEWLALLLRIREDQVSNLDLETGYPD